MSRRLNALICRWFGGVSSKRLLAGSFGLILFFTTVVTALWLSRSGDKITGDMMARLAAGTHLQLQRELQAYIGVPDKINRQTIAAIRHGRVDPKSPDALAALAYDSPWRTERGAVSGIFFGSPDGEFTGMGVDASDVTNPNWAFMRASPSQTEGRLSFVTPLPDGAMGAVASKGVKFDLRARPWYEFAVAAGGEPVWTEAYYANAEDGSPILTRAQAVYDERGKLLGVAGVDLFFEQLQGFVENQAVGDNGEVFIYDGSAVLLAAHAAGGKGGRFTPWQPLAEGQLRFTRAASLYVRERAGSFTQLPGPLRAQVTLDGEDGFLFVSMLPREQGLDWSFGVFLPRSDYNSPSLLRLLPLLLLMTALIWLSMTVFIHLVVEPLLQLRKSAYRIASGDFDTRINVNCTNEIGQLAQAIEGMRLSLKSSFANLWHQKRQAESTLHAITDGVITVDAHGRLLYLNAAAARHTGVAFEEALGQSVERVFRVARAPGGLPMPPGALLDLHHRHRRNARELTLSGPDDVPMLVHCRVTKIEHADPEHARVVFVFRDVEGEKHRQEPATGG